VREVPDSISNYGESFYVCFFVLLLLRFNFFVQNIQTTLFVMKVSFAMLIYLVYLIKILQFFNNYKNIKIQTKHIKTSTDHALTQIMFRLYSGYIVFQYIIMSLTDNLTKMTRYESDIHVRRPSSTRWYCMVTKKTRNLYSVNNKKPSPCILCIPLYVKPAFFYSLKPHLNKMFWYINFHRKVFVFVVIIILTATLKIWYLYLLCLYVVSLCVTVVK